MGSGRLSVHIQTQRGRTVGRGRTYWGTPAKRTRDKKFAEVSDPVRPSDRLWLLLRRQPSRCWISCGLFCGLREGGVSFPPNPLSRHVPCIQRMRSGQPTAPLAVGKTLVRQAVTAVHGEMTRRPVSRKERGGRKERPLQRPSSRHEASGATLLPRTRSRPQSVTATETPLPFPDWMMYIGEQERTP